MYGLVNRGFQHMIIHEHGLQAWQAIAQQANLASDTFITMNAYDDEITYRLLQVAAQVTNCTQDDLLWNLGVHWMQFTAREGFGELLRLGGRNVLEFLANLDSMHARVALTFPELRPPSFRVEIESPQCVRLHYRSDRRGLTSFVVGLLVGLGKHFNESIDVRLEDSTDPANTRFLVTRVELNEDAR